MNSAAVDADLLRRYRYLFDLGGNRTQEISTIGATTTTDYEYTAANQIDRRRVNAGAWTNFTYDNNGNLTNDGTNTYGWDRANRLNQRGLNYTYDGYGNRFQGDVTKYLLDIQPGLSEVIREEDTGSHGGFYGPPYFVHGSHGLHAFNRVNSGSGARYWTWPLEDGLGSIRVNVDSTGGVLESRNYDPYGNSFNPTGTSQTDYGFTGEPTDSNGLLYLRARYYNPAVGVFTALDPFEGMTDRPMSLNGYSWVEGNTPNAVDLNGNIPSKADIDGGTTRYSCKCGWLDGRHIAAGGQKARNMFNALTQNIDWNGVVPHERVVIISGNTGLGSFHFFAYIPDSIHSPLKFASSSPAAMLDVALGVIMAYEQGFESAQSIGNPFDGFWGKRASGFAEEDLTSDLVGFYLGRQMWLGSPTPTDLWTNTSISTELNQLCGDVMTKADSEHMRLEYEANGGFKLDWGHWYKRDRPQGTTLPRGNQCSAGEAWPTDLTNLTASATPPEGTIKFGDFREAFTGLEHSIGGLSNTGWWIIEGLERSTIDNFGLLRFESDYLYTIPLDPNQQSVSIPKGYKGYWPKC